MRINSKVIGHLNRAGLMVIGLIALTLFASKALAQFESEPVSVAVDNTNFQFFAQRWAPQTQSFTKGGSAMRSFHVEGTSFPSVGAFISTGNKTVTFDYRFETTVGDELSFVAYTEFGAEPVNQVIASATTNGWQTRTFYIPASVIEIQWHHGNSFGDTVGWLDNVRIVEGNQTSSGGGNSGGGSTPNDGPPYEFANNALSEAVDNTRFQFLNGAPGFFRQTGTSNVGGDAAQSANIGNSQQSLMGVDITGPTTISFDWKVSSEEGFDFLIAAVFDSNLQQTNIGAAISGNQDWQRHELQIPAGNYLMIWAYVKDNIISAGQDTGWIDHVEIGGLSDVEEPVSMAAIISLLLDENE